MMKKSITATVCGKCFKIAVMNKVALTVAGDWLSHSGMNVEMNLLDLISHTNLYHPVTGRPLKLISS